MLIRPVRPEECEALGLLTVRAYRQLAGDLPLGDYEQVLSNVAARLVDCDILVAVNDDDVLMGGVTYVPGPHTSMSEFDDEGAAGVRHLAVDPSQQGSGAGRALIDAVIAHARVERRARLRLHSTQPMVVARAMYERLGFVRAEQFDLFFSGAPYSEHEPLHLISYVLDLETT
jgi:GNAT superfamily N-acetyltransferase